VFDFGAYLSRVGLARVPDVSAMHAAHVRSIPFENLDPHIGVASSTVPADVARKLVAQRRGGICFEHAVLFKAAAEASGATVDVFLARIRMGDTPLVERPRSHPILRYRFGGAEWLADVGLGTGGLIEPIRLLVGPETHQEGWRFRLRSEDPELVLQVAGSGTSVWSDLYGFRPEPVPSIELEVSNWFTTTHPLSRFVQGICVSRYEPGGSRVILTDWDGPLRLVRRIPESATSVPVAWREVPPILAERFGLTDFSPSQLGPNRTAKAYGAATQSALVRPVAPSPHSTS
jgi:N-hydroxyarylamine O-acetyltransferase